MLPVEGFRRHPVDRWIDLRQKMDGDARREAQPFYTQRHRCSHQVPTNR